MDKPEDTDVQITKEVFHVKYKPPQYIDLITDETDVTHISETQIPPKEDITVISSDDYESDSDTLSLKSNTSGESGNILS